MRNALYIYGRMVGIAIRGQMQYRWSFLLQTVGHLCATGIEFLGVWALFARFHSLSGWRLPQVALLYGMVNVAFALAEATSRGFDDFGRTVKQGDFDRVLLRPRSTVLQLAGQDFVLRRAGRLSQGVLVLCWAASTLGLAFTPWKILLLLFAILGGVCFFYGLLVLQATTAFWTTESLEVFNAFTYGGVFSAQYPVTIYPGWLRRLLTAVIPLAAVNYFPAMALLGKPDPLGSSFLFQCLSPLLGITFLLIALQIWRLGVRHYCSTGS